jgi:NAD(P)-dependent dehydrogenase (short-subunit alcohol dehydrogenase family)
MAIWHGVTSWGGVIMQIQRGMAAFVSGAGSGIGRGMALQLAARGVAVGVVDIRPDDARETVALIEAAGGRAVAVQADVSDQAAVDAAADAVESALGPVRIACNNAGVAMHGVPLHEIALKDWDWVIGVNVYGVIHGIRTFVPRMLAQGVPCHIVNTASIGGFQVNPNFLTAAYSMTKFAAVALSEGLQQELSGTSVGVSVLAPAAVDTGIHLSARARPDRLGGAYVRPENHFMGDLIKDGAKPEDMGAMVVAAIEAGDFYIFPHPETWHWLAARHDRIRAGFDRSIAGYGLPKAAE